MYSLTRQEGSLLVLAVLTVATVLVLGVFAGFPRATDRHRGRGLEPPQNRDRRDRPAVASRLLLELRRRHDSWSRQSETSG
jgi:hypothetical protein